MVYDPPAEIYILFEASQSQKERRNTRYQVTSCRSYLGEKIIQYLPTGNCSTYPLPSKGEKNHQDKKLFDSLKLF